MIWFFKFTVTGPASAQLPRDMPRKRLRQPLELFSKHLSVELDEHSQIQINVNRRTDEGREVSRKFVFRVSESAVADMGLHVSGKFNSGVHPKRNTGAHPKKNPFSFQEKMSLIACIPYQ